jgi:hypothetical protein
LGLLLLPPHVILLFIFPIQGNCDEKYPKMGGKSQQQTQKTWQKETKANKKVPT